MIYYSEGYCKPYRQGMPVQYEKKDGKYCKSGMACMKDGCVLEKCENFLNAPDTIEEFRLLKKEYGK